MAIGEFAKHRGALVSQGSHVLDSVVKPLVLVTGGSSVFLSSTVSELLEEFQKISDLKWVSKTANTFKQLIDDATLFEPNPYSSSPYCRNRLALSKNKANLFNIAPYANYRYGDFSSSLIALKKRANHSAFQVGSLELNLDQSSFEIYDKIWHLELRTQKLEQSNYHSGSYAIEIENLFLDYWRDRYRCTLNSIVDRLHANMFGWTESWFLQSVLNYRDTLQSIYKSLKHMRGFYLARDRFAISMSKQFCINTSSQLVQLRCIRSDPDAGQSDCALVA